VEGDFLYPVFGFGWFSPWRYWPGETLTVILVVAFLAALVGVATAALWLIYQIAKILIGGIILIWEKVPKPQFHVSLPAEGFIPQPVRNAAANVGGIFSMVWHFLVALEHRTLCPWITFKDGVIEFEFAPEPSKPSALAAEMQRATDVVMSSAAKVQAATAIPKPKTGYRKSPSTSKAIRPRRKKTKS
jgi:hypothetical protein